MFFYFYIKTKKENIMSFKNLSIAFTLFAAFGLMACGDDSSSSSSSNEKNVAESPSDPVKCKFKEGDNGLSFTKTLTIENKNSGEIDTIKTVGSCIKENCSVVTYTKGETDSSVILDFDEDEEHAQYYQSSFKEQKDLHKEDCETIDGSTRQQYENYIALMESISCTVDDSTDTHYEQTFTKDGEEESTEYTLDGTTITIQLAEPIIGKNDSRCPDKDEIQNDEKQVTCDNNFMTSKSKVEAKDEDDAKDKFARLIKSSYNVCKQYSGAIKH